MSRFTRINIWSSLVDLEMFTIWSSKRFQTKLILLPEVSNNTKFNISKNQIYTLNQITRIFMDYLFYSFS